MDEKWFENAVFYHIYPLGFSGAPKTNDRSGDPVHRLALTDEDIDGLLDLGINAVYFGPVFESMSHGYDTVDYRRIDRRLGDEESFRGLVRRLHDRGIRVVLDGVFNHVGRDFPAFRSLRRDGRESPYADWFKDVDFESDNRFGDGFAYRGWEGHDDLVTLNLANEGMKNYLLDAVGWMIDVLGVDGLRLDVAYLLDEAFITELADYGRKRRSDFWLMGEMIHGDYNRIVGPGKLDSATNYECYKGLYSSHNDRNLFEIAWSLNRLFGKEGLCRETLLYNFIDNHDVDRIASVLERPEHLHTIHALLFTMPGIPSVYYGSEWKSEGRRTPEDDSGLRPPWRSVRKDDGEIADQIRLLAGLRNGSPALRKGSYEQLEVRSEQLAFRRRWNGQELIIAVNIAAEGSGIRLPGGRYRNILNPKETVVGGRTAIIPHFGWKVFERTDQAPRTPLISA